MSKMRNSWDQTAPIRTIHGAHISFASAKFESIQKLPCQQANILTVTTAYSGCHSLLVPLSLYGSFQILPLLSWMYPQTTWTQFAETYLLLSCLWCKEHEEFCQDSFCAGKVQKSNLECLRKSITKKFSAFEIRCLQEQRASEQEISASAWYNSVLDTASTQRLLLHRHPRKAHHINNLGN